MLVHCALGVRAEAGEEEQRDDNVPASQQLQLAVYAQDCRRHEADQDRRAEREAYRGARADQTVARHGAADQAGDGSEGDDTAEDLALVEDAEPEGEEALYDGCDGRARCLCQRSSGDGDLQMPTERSEQPAQGRRTHRHGPGQASERIRLAKVVDEAARLAQALTADARDVQAVDREDDAAVVSSALTTRRTARAERR